MPGEQIHVGMERKRKPICPSTAPNEDDNLMYIQEAIMDEDKLHKATAPRGGTIYDQQGKLRMVVAGNGAYSSQGSENARVGQGSGQ